MRLLMAGPPWHWATASAQPWWPNPDPSSKLPLILTLTLTLTLIGFTLCEDNTFHLLLQRLYLLALGLNFPLQYNLDNDQLM